MKWDCSTLEKVTSILAVAHPDEWAMVAKEIRARNGRVKYTWFCSSGDPQDDKSGWHPRHDPETDTVLIRNPFPGRRTTVDGRSINSDFIEIDSSMATKILVLGFRGGAV